MLLQLIVSHGGEWKKDSKEAEAAVASLGILE